jgi:hypothetical protein
VHNLASGMDAGVGAACRHRLHGSMRIEGGDGLLEGLLNAGMVRLALPAKKGCPVVLETKSDTTNCR